MAEFDRRDILKLLAAAGTSVSFLTCRSPYAHAASTPYQIPPEPIPQILDAQPTPVAVVSPSGRTAALLEEVALPPIATLARPRLSLAGMRIDPTARGNAETRHYSSLSLISLENDRSRPIAVPDGCRIHSFKWSPDGSRAAFLMETAAGHELWAVDEAWSSARRICTGINAVAFSRPDSSAAYSWLPDGEGFVALLAPDLGNAPEEQIGPHVAESTGRPAPRRNPAQLLRTSHDDALFAHYFTSTLAHVRIDGVRSTIAAPDIYLQATPSPDGRFVLVTRASRPFSHVVALPQFATVIDVLALDGTQVRRVADLPSGETNPPGQDSVRTGPRWIHWRSDKSASLAWVEAADGGDGNAPAEIRDHLYVLDDPFQNDPVVLARLADRFFGMWWGRDDFALVQTFSWRHRRRAYVAVDPSRPPSNRTLVSWSAQEPYSDPGKPLLRSNSSGNETLHFTPDGAAIFTSGQGASPTGDFPFIARMNVRSGLVERLWVCDASSFEEPMALLDQRGSRVLTSRQSASSPPNYVVRNRESGTSRMVTRFTDPAPQFARIHREELTYVREDGTRLGGALYLPAGHRRERDERLPLLIWGYPLEFTDASAAQQLRRQGNRFTRPGSSNRYLLLLTQGYAVLEAGMPIIATGGGEPNDTFVEQLVANATAAVDAAVGTGTIDAKRIAIGGHSYGAFMAANLLAHTNLFRTGIAMSGAYNRTLSPFGFQQEDRSFWQIPDVYMRMSPFSVADQIDEPILIIHGEDDGGTGTPVIQSELFFSALNGLGGRARFVSLPFEGHSYAARESVMHMMWEITQWLEIHLARNRP